MSDAQPQRRLGRGLEALLGPVNKEQAAQEGTLRELPVGSIRPNPWQPRNTIEPAKLQELADSIQASGLLQPVVVRQAAGGTYELIAGERRWRAVQKLGWAKVPAVVKEADDRTLLTLAIIENIQRAELSPLEEARSYQRLMDEFQASQAEVGRLVGRDRSTVANALRLLKLPDAVRQLLDDGQLSEGHARALLAVADETLLVRMARQAVLEGWSVREVESRVRGERPAGAPKRGKGGRPAKPVSADARRVEEALRKHLGTDVKLHPQRRGRGLITVQFYSNDDLARLLELILGRPFEG
ncbi:MAG TPA: ParB/RepB/Spo0J family partition protein [Gemmatimonadales bacterium]|jgi:ParB family chromosome partitioning protein|nr:ParB/RepB/Spo0J family partition protein [Gemmatimonadales bacterium]